MNSDRSKILKYAKNLKDNKTSSIAPLYSLTYQRIYMLCFLVLQNKNLAKEVSIKAWSTILKNRKNMGKSNDFLIWAYKITYKLSFEALLTSSDDEFQASGNDFSHVYTTQELLSSFNNAKVLAEGIVKIDPVLRAILFLKVYERISVKNIGTITNYNTGNIRKKLTETKKELKEHQLNSSQGISSSLPIKEALTFLASQNQMGETDSKEQFDKVITSLNLKNPIKVFKLSPPPSPLSVRLSSLILLTSIVIITVIIAGGAIILAFMPPKLINLDIRPQGPEYTNKQVQITGRVLSPFQSIYEAYMISETGVKYEAEILSLKKLEFYAPENGDYSLHIVTSRKQESKEVVTISNIDSTPPSIKTHSISKGKIIFHIDDDLSGINFNTIRGEDLQGNTIAPITIDTKKSTTVFDFSNSTFRLYMNDNAGNESKHKISPHTN